MSKLEFLPDRDAIWQSAGRSEWPGSAVRTRVGQATTAAHVLGNHPSAVTCQ